MNEKESSKKNPSQSSPGYRSRCLSLNQTLTVAALILVLVGAVFFAFRNSSGAEPAEATTPAKAKGLPVEVVPVAVDSIRREISAVGSLHPDESVIIATEVAGRVAEIAFAEGEPVRPGQVLLRLDDSIQRAERDRAEATLQLNEANYRRAERLLADNAIAQRERDEAFAQWRLAEANLRLAVAQLDKTVIRAPFAGSVGLRNISAGSYLRPGDPVATLSAVDPVKVDFRIPEGFAGSLRKGQTLQVAVDAAPGRLFAGEVYAIDPQVEAGGRSLLLRARVANEKRTLSPGMFARVTLVIEERPDALLVPEEALFAQGGTSMVYKVVDGVVEAARVVTGLRLKGRVEIVEGLREGDVIITAGHLKVRPGMPVTALPSAAVAAPRSAKIGG